MFLGCGDRELRILRIDVSNTTALHFSMHRIIIVDLCPQHPAILGKTGEDLSLALVFALAPSSADVSLFTPRHRTRRQRAIAFEKLLAYCGQKPPNNCFPRSKWSVEYHTPHCFPRNQLVRYRLIGLGFHFVDLQLEQFRP